jgi:hypothetical protein
LKDIPCIPAGYLADGEIRVWDGPRKEVLSPDWVANDNDPKPFFVGDYSTRLIEANMINSSYGQQVRIFGSDPDQIARLIDPLVNQVCRVNIQHTSPFDSAEGTLSVPFEHWLPPNRRMNKMIITRIVREHKSKFLATDFILELGGFYVNLNVV